MTKKEVLIDYGKNIDNNVMTRPIWNLMSKLPMFQDCQTDSFGNSFWLEDREINIPSSVPDVALTKLKK